MIIINEQDLKDDINKKLQQKKQKKHLGIYFSTDKSTANKKAIQEKVEKINALLDVLKDRGWK